MAELKALGLSEDLFEELYMKSAPLSVYAVAFSAAESASLNSRALW